MPTQRFLHRRSTRDAIQISPSLQDNMRCSNRWWTAGLLLVAVIGGIIGYFSLPSHVSDIVDPGYSLSAEGLRIFAVCGGSLVFLILGLMLKAAIESVRNKRPSRRSLFWWGIAIFLAAIVGAILGSMYLPYLLLTFSRVLLGAFIGLVGLALLRAFIADPLGLLGGVMEGFVGDGCCLSLFVLFITIVGAVSGLLLWHTFLLSVLTGGGMALITVIACVGLAFSNRKEEILKKHKNDNLYLS